MGPNNKDIIYSLMIYYPKSVEIQDYDRNLPFNYVYQMKRENYMDLLKKLLDIYLFSIHIKNKMRHTPLKCSQTLYSHYTITPILLNFLNYFNKTLAVIIIKITKKMFIMLRTNT